MTIRVNGAEREIKAVGSNSIEWTIDLLGNYEALQTDEDGNYTMSEDDFAWWEQIVEMEQELSTAQRADYEAEGFYYSDLEDVVAARLDWLLSA